MNMKVTEAVNAAKGQWPHILPALGVNVVLNRHQPCPVCQGKDRFRFDDKDGRGTWYCNQCGAGDGLSLVSKALAVSVAEAASQVNSVTGNLPPVPADEVATVPDSKKGMKEAAALAARLLEASRTTTGNAYLTRKGLASLACQVLTTTHKVATISYRAGDVLVPLHTPEGNLVNLQLINADGTKRTLKGGQVKGTCHTLEGKNSASKRLWLVEGYATGLTVNQLTGDTVLVALSSVNLLSLASLVRERHPTQQLIIAADRDLNGDGQTKAAAAANACQGLVALPPVFGDWNDAFMQHGEEATLKALQEAVRAPAASPFDQMSEAEFTAMSTSEKAMRVSEHYGHALAVDPNGEIISRYEAGAWKVLPSTQFARDVAALFQRIGAGFSSGKISAVVDTLKLILVQHEAPARRLIGFRNGVLDTTSGIFNPHSKTHWLRTLCDVDFTPPVSGGNAGARCAAFLAVARPCRRTERAEARHYSRRAVYGAGEPLRLAALSRSDRARWQREKYHGRDCHHAGREGQHNISRY